MSKHGFLTPKAISNRVKSIGLQKLRWYCQMCQKQCRDENGFKCHISSESHLRQMRIFAENSGSIIDEFSQEFERGFVETMSHRHGTKRVQANRVYQEYIADKNHVHMNATIWTSLSEFVKYIGKEGKAVVDETEKGWFVTWIDRDPKLIAKQAAAQQRQRTELDEEQRTRRAIELQIAAAAMRQAEQQQQEQHDESGMENGVDGGDDEVVPGAEYVPSDGATKIGMSLKMADTAKKRPIRSISFDPAVTADEGLEEPVAKRAAVGGNGTFQPSSASSSSSSASSSSSNSLAAPKAAASSSSRPLSAVEQLMQEEEKRKEVQLQLDDKRDRKDYWLHPGIVVKIMSRKLAEGRFYKKKASVLKVIDKYVGEVRVDETGTIVRIDQDDLETVIPKVGGSVMIVNGRGRGLRATVLRIHEDKFSCDLRLLEGDRRDMPGVVYEDMSKIVET